MSKTKKIYTDVITLPATLASSKTLTSDTYEIPYMNEELIVDIQLSDNTKILVSNTYVKVDLGTISDTAAIASSASKSTTVTALATNDTFIVTLFGTGWASPNTYRSDFLGTAFTVTVPSALNGETDAGIAVRGLNDLLNAKAIISSGEYILKRLGDFVQFGWDVHGMVCLQATEVGSNFGFTVGACNITTKFGLTAASYKGTDVEWTETSSTTLASGAAVNKLVSVTTTGYSYARFRFVTDATASLDTGHGITLDACMTGPELVSLAASRPQKIYNDLTFNALTFTAGTSQYIYTTDTIELEECNGNVYATCYVADLGKFTNVVKFKIQTTQGTETTYTVGAGGATGIAAGSTSGHTVTKWVVNSSSVWQDCDSTLTNTTQIPNGSGAAIYNLTQTTGLLRFVRVVVYDSDGSGALAAASGLTASVVTY